MLYRLNKESREDSQTDVFGFYTTTHSWKVGFDQILSFKEDRFRSKTSGRFGNVNNRFEYPSLPSDVVYGEPQNVVTSNIAYNIIGRLYAGVNYRYIKTKYVFDEGTEEEQEFSKEVLGLAGAEDATGSGLGLIAGYDSRDHEYTPTKGIHTDLQFLTFRDWMGSDNDYSTVESFFNIYWKVRQSQVLAFRFRWWATHGDVPFNGQSTYGGVDLRGYATGKYRGDGMIAGQAEYRFPVWKRVSGVVFGGTGRVYGNRTTLGADQILPSGGAGVRFLLLKDRGANIGLDFAIGKDGNSGVYFHFGEAF
jgi:outer membrane protein assembly factor BamA